MKLSELIEFLNSIDVKPKKSLSQNFLIDENIVKKIIKTAEINEGDLVLEIGPGPGSLTKPLLDSGAEVFAIEKDNAFAAALKRFQSEKGRLHIFHGDALDFSYATLPSGLKVVANLPYHITTPLLERLFERGSLFKTLTLMMQKEVADRLAAKPSTKDYSSLTLFTQFYTEIKTRFTVSASCFYPKPKVASAVVHLEMRKEWPLSDPKPFFSLVRKAFQQRRKMIRTSLKGSFSEGKIDKSLKDSGIDEKARPEMLSLEKWLTFFNEINS